MFTLSQQNNFVAKDKMLPNSENTVSKKVLSQKKKGKPTQSRNWCFTDFEELNFGEIYKEYKDIIRYIIWGREICPKTKKVHNQGWIQLVNKKLMGGVKRLLGTKKIHLEPMWGNEYSNEKYCKKENDWKSEGKFIKQGERSDLERVKKKISDGATMEEVAEDHFGLWCQYGRQFKEYQAMKVASKTKKFRKLEVLVHKGMTGTGKTRDAMNACDNPYKIQGDELQWWDGYMGQKELVIDEYANQIPVTKLLSILDGYQLRLPIKGGFTYAQWEKVYITTNLHVLHINAKPEHQKALERRITKTIDYSELANAPLGNTELRVPGQALPISEINR